MTCAELEDLRYVGDPIDVVTGAFLEDTKDFQLVGPTPIVWRRLYSSRAVAEDRGLGRGHSHSFDHRLRIDLDGVRYVAPDGRTVAFSLPTVDGARVARRGFVLRRRGLRLLLETPDGVTLTFELTGAEGVLVEVASAVGVVHLTYAADGRLEGLASTSGTVRLFWDATHIVRAEGARSSNVAPVPLATYRYDAAGCLVELEDAYGATVRYVHDADGRVLARADRRGYRFGFRYDADGRCVHSAAEDGVLEVRLEYRPLERRTRVEKSDGGVWEYTYDDAGSLTSIRDPLGSTRSFVHDPLDGRVVAETDGAGNELTYVYDADGRLLGKRDREGRAVRGPGWHEVASQPYAYELGRFGAAPEVLPASAVHASALPPLARSVVTFARGPHDGRLRRITDPQGLLVRVERDGRVRRYGYDSGGNLRWSIDFDGARRDYDVESFFQLRTERDTAQRATSFTYTSENALASVVDPGGTVTLFRRDLRSDVAAIARAGAWKESYERDGAGRLVRKLGARGLRYEIDRGAQGEVVARRFASGGFETYEHDAELRIVRAETPAGVATFAFDADGHRVRDELDGRGVRKIFAEGKLSELSVLDRFVTRVRHETSASGPRRVLVDPTGAEHTLVDHGGGLFVRTHAGGRTETVQFRPDGRCVHRIVEGGAAPAWVRSYDHSPEGYLLARHDSQRGTTRYQHDAARRVIGEAPPGAPPRALVHDAAGNLLAYGARTFAYQPGNLLVGASDAVYGYGAEQAIETETAPLRARRFRRDERGQLVAIETFARANEASGTSWSPGPTWSATYDGKNRRVTKTFDGKTTRFVWDGDRLAAEIAPDGRLRVYVYADDLALTPLLFVDYRDESEDPAAGVVHVVLADDMSRPERVERLDGTLVWSATYDVYGAATITHGAAFPQPLRWPGHYADVELDLHYNRFRTYAPSLGRYLEPDPLGRGGGLENVYAYTSNPLRWVDVDGLQCPHAASEDEGGGRPDEGAPDEEAPGRLRDERGRFMRDPNAPDDGRIGRDDVYPSGFRQSTHDEMALRHTDEGQAHLAAHEADPTRVPAPPPVRAAGGTGEPLDRSQMTWRDADGEVIPFHARDENGEVRTDRNGRPITNLTYDHDPPLVQRYNDGDYQQSQAYRNDDFNDPDHLTPMSRSDNSSSGASLGQTYRQDPPTY